MMQCNDIDERMVEFLYQELEGEQLAEFQKHVDGCARCGAEMKSLMRTRQALRALPEAEPSAAVSARLLHEAAKRAPRPKEESGGVLAWIGKLFGPLAAHPAWAAAASLLLVATVAGFLSVSRKMNGQLRVQETAATSTPATAEIAPAQPATAPPPRDVTVAGGDGTKGEVARATLDETGKVAEEKAAAASTAKEVREVGDKAPDPYYRKVAAPAGGPTGKKGKALADEPAADDASDRYGRTASTEEDLKLAQPAKPLAKSAPSRAKQEVSKDADLGGVAATPPPPPAPEPAPSAGLTQGYVAKEQAQSAAEGRRDNAVDTRGAKAKAPVASAQSSLGAGAPAAAAPAPPQAPPATTTANRGEPKDSLGNARDEERGAAQAEVESQAKGDTRPAPKVAPEQELLQLAQKQATTGLCSEALGTRDRIARMNPEFFRRRVAGDSTLRRCEEQNKKNRPARAVKPAAADEAPLEKVTK